VTPSALAVPTTTGTLSPLACNSFEDSGILPTPFGLGYRLVALPYPFTRRAHGLAQPVSRRTTSGDALHSCTVMTAGFT
jgi:hypothetical protein